MTFLLVGLTVNSFEGPDKSLETRRKPPVLQVASGLPPLLVIIELSFTVRMGACTRACALRQLCNPFDA